MKLYIFNFWYSAEMVSLQRENFANIYVSHGKKDINIAYTALHEGAILLIDKFACEVGNLTHDENEGISKAPINVTSHQLTRSRQNPHNNIDIIPQGDFQKPMRYFSRKPLHLDSKLREIGASPLEVFYHSFNRFNR
jgi:hypothetical protein